MMNYFRTIAGLSILIYLLFSCKKTDAPIVTETIVEPSVNDSLIGTVATDPLPSWKNSPRKERIIAFVKAVTDTASNAYVTPAERIATFDNDGTLWSESPYFYELQFTFDRIVAMAPNHPRWKRDRLIRAVVEFDKKKIRSFGGDGIFRLITITHSNVTTSQFETIVKNWINTAKHPKTGKLYKQMVYQPMLELINYLKSNNFKVYIVTGGWTNFLRPWVEEVYGIPKEQVIGSRMQLSYKLTDGKPTLFIEPDVEFMNNEENKVIAIYQASGKQPILAFGNSDGDIQMLTWTSSGTGKRLSGLIHHTDAKREWAYDKNADFGRLDAGLDAARKNNWLIVDMKKDWRVIYPYQIN